MTDLARRRPRLAGAVVLGLCAVASLLILTRTVPVIGGGGGPSVKLVFAAADDLRVGDAVRVHGIRVGGVTSIRLGDSTRDAVVTARITNEGLRLTNAARATLRWGTLLGGSVYVDLDPGSPLAAPMRGNLIPRTRTATQVTFDDLNNVYTANTRQASQTVFAQMSRALSDTRTAGRAIDTLGPSLRELRLGLTPLLGTRDGDLERLVMGTARTVDGLGRDADALRSVVADAAATLQVTADERAGLGRMVRDFPPALDSLRLTTKQLDGTLRLLDPLVARLRPGARQLVSATRAAAPAFRRAATVLTAAEPLLRDLGPALRSLRTASRPGVTLITGLTPMLARLRDDLLPWLDRTDPDTGRPTIDMIGPTAAATDSAAGEFDGISNWLHFAPEGDERSFLDSPCEPFFTDPTAGQTLRCQALAEVVKKVVGASVGAR